MLYLSAFRESRLKGPINPRHLESSANLQDHEYLPKVIQYSGLYVSIIVLCDLKLVVFIIGSWAIAIQFLRFLAQSHRYQGPRGWGDPCASPWTWGDAACEAA